MAELNEDWIVVPPVTLFEHLNNVMQEEKTKCVNTDGEEKIHESSSSKNDSSSSNKEKVKNSPIFHNMKDDLTVVAINGETLWVSWIAEKKAITADDLKALFSKYGKVSTVKIFREKTPSARNYGTITMDSPGEALICIEKLKRFVLQTSTATVEKTSVKPNGSTKKSDVKSTLSKETSKKSEKLAESSQDVSPAPSQLPDSVTNTLATTTQSSNFDSLGENSNFSKVCDIKAEKIPTKPDVLQETPQVPSNTPLQDISSTDFSGTSDQRKYEHTADRLLRMLGVGTRKRDTAEDRKAHQDQFSELVVILCCILMGLMMIFSLDSKSMKQELELAKTQAINDLNSTITALQRENLFLKRQIFHCQIKENRKLSSLSNLVSIKLEEKENITRKYQEQLEVEVSYLKEINSLKEKVSSCETDYKVLQEQLTEKISVVEESDENDILSRKCLRSMSRMIAEKPFFPLCLCIICIISLFAQLVFSGHQTRNSRRETN